MWGTCSGLQLRNCWWPGLLTKQAAMYQRPVKNMFIVTIFTAFEHRMPQSLAYNLQASELRLMLNSSLCSAQVSLDYTHLTYAMWGLLTFSLTDAGFSSSFWWPLQSLLLLLYVAQNLSNMSLDCLKTRYILWPYVQIKESSFSSDHQGCHKRWYLSTQEPRRVATAGTDRWGFAETWHWRMLLWLMKPATISIWAVQI